MATQARVHESMLDSAENPEILSHDQIEQLLQEATDRLTNASDPAAMALEATENEDVIALGTVRKRKRLPRLTHSLEKVAYIEVDGGIAQADQRRLLDDKQRKLSNVLRSVEVDQLRRGKQKKEDKTSSGAEWFDLPKTVMTPQLKRDLQLIEMRSVLDPHRHYKKSSGKNKVPVFSQVGTVIEGPTEWYSSRINKKDRAKNIVEEAMAGEKQTGHFKKKYDEIQGKKTSGRKSYYKSLMEKRRKQK